jgi:hypothetical protein
MQVWQIKQIVLTNLYLCPIAETLVSSFKHYSLKIKEKRIDQISLPIKKRFKILDSLDAQVYISLSNDIKNDSNLFNMMNVKNRIQKIRAHEKRSKLASMFFSEYFKKSGIKLPENAIIFYPVTSMLSNENRPTHMVINLNPVLNSIENKPKNKIIKNVVNALNFCIRRYISLLK